MKRRSFNTLLGGAAAWPLAARAQPGDRVRRIGVLIAGDENNPAYKSPASAFTQALAALGWTACLAVPPSIMLRADEQIE